jgi:hypothetical protein
VVSRKEEGRVKIEEYVLSGSPTDHLSLFTICLPIPLTDRNSSAWALMMASMLPKRARRRRARSGPILGKRFFQKVRE